MERTESTRIIRGEMAGSRWELAERTPAPWLRSHVIRLCGYEERTARPRPQRQFPVPMVVLIIELGPALRVRLGGEQSEIASHPGGFVAGLGDTYSILDHDGWQRGIQVDVTPTGARRLFGMPMSELAGQVVALRDVLPRHDRAWMDRLAELPDWPARLDAVEHWLAGALAEATIDTRRVDAAMNRIAASGGALRAGTLARDLGCSHKHLITLFRDQVGVPPKLYAQLVRFERLMARATSGSAARWIELALDAGYCDQAHLARDVRRFTGLTPTAARAQYPDLVALVS